LTLFLVFRISSLFYVSLSATKLSSDLEEWLNATGLTKSPDVRGVIAP